MSYYQTKMEKSFKIYKMTLGVFVLFEVQLLINKEWLFGGKVKEIWPKLQRICKSFNVCCKSRPAGFNSRYKPTQIKLGSAGVIPLNNTEMHCSLNSFTQVCSSP